MGKSKQSTALRRKLPTLKTFGHDKIKTTILVKSSSPYLSIVKRTNKFLQELDKRKRDYVTLLGMGKAVFKTLSVASHFDSMSDYNVTIFTRTLEVVDELYADAGTNEDENSIPDEDRETRLSSRSLSGVEVHISIV